MVELDDIKIEWNEGPAGEMVASAVLTVHFEGCVSPPLTRLPAIEYHQVQHEVMCNLKRKIMDHLYGDLREPYHELIRTARTNPLHDFMRVTQLQDQLNGMLYSERGAYL